MSTLAIFGLFQVPSSLTIEDYPKETLPVILICFSFFHIVLSIWVLHRKFESYSLIDYQHESITELKETINWLKSIEEKQYEYSARENASVVATFSTLILVIIVIMAKKIIKYGYEAVFNIVPESIMIFPLITITSFLIGDLIGRPRLPKNQVRLQHNLLYRLNEALHISLNNSLLNPEKTSGRNK